MRFQFNLIFQGHNARKSIRSTVHDSRGSGGLKGPSGACLGPRVECLAWPMDDPVPQSIEAGSEP